MAILRFPPVTSSTADGLLAMGGDLEVPSLLLAYRSGIFPWPLDDDHLAWFSPPVRCILYLDKLHVSGSLKKILRRNTFTFKRSENFEQVISKCSLSPHRKKGGGTWITPGMQRAYIDLFHAGYAESFECYANNTLVGGLYGVRIGNFFAGESMFFDLPNASKVALVFMRNQLLSEGVTWVDCQVKNPFMDSMGAEEVSREYFLSLLTTSLIR